MAAILSMLLGMTAVPAIYLRQTLLTYCLNLKKISKKKIGVLSYEKILYRDTVDLLLASKEKLAEPWRVSLAADNSYWCLGCGAGW